MKPKFVPVDLTQLQDAGVLLAANVTFFWPFGLALTWEHDRDTGEATGLYVSEWRFRDGHHETIALEPNDDVLPKRQQGYAEWVAARIGALPLGERGRAEELSLALKQPPVLEDPS